MSDIKWNKSMQIINKNTTKKVQPWMSINTKEKDKENVYQFNHKELEQ